MNDVTGLYRTYEQEITTKCSIAEKLKYYAKRKRQILSAAIETAQRRTLSPTEVAICKEFLKET